MKTTHSVRQNPNRHTKFAQARTAAFCAVACGLIWVSCPAARAAEWRPVAQVAPGRSAHTATLLDNGLVLVCGGTQTGVANEGINNCVILDTWTSGWLAAPPMSQARAHHQAIRLLNGKVLVTGGAGPGGSGAGSYLSSCEIYDPAANTWSSAASMGTATADHRLALLDNGKVLRVGGSDAWGFGDSVCELYDPVANTWTATGELTVPRYSAAVAKLKNGKVIAAGGYDFTDSVELYDPASGAWSPVGNLPLSVSDPAAVALPDGRALIMGGEYWSGTHLHENTVTIYDPTTALLMAGPQMSVGRAHFQAELLPDGDVLAIGGAASNANYSTTVVCERLNLGTMSWSPAPALNNSRCNFTAVLAPGRVFVLGGLAFTATGIATVASVESLVLSDADTDGDGLPDWWEMYWFGNLAQGPGDDPDGDGYTNAQEYASGTNPTAADVGPTSIWTAVELGWRSVSGRNYQVQCAPTPSGPWENSGSPLPGTGSYMTMLQSTRTVAQRYYRIVFAP